MECFILINTKQRVNECQNFILRKAQEKKKEQNQQERERKSHEDDDHENDEKINITISVWIKLLFI